MNTELIRMNLLSVLADVKEQADAGDFFPKEMQSFPEQMGQIQEYIEIAGECGIAYELLVAILERFPFKLRARNAINLLEAGLLFGFKTERIEDSQFDRRIKKA